MARRTTLLIYFFVSLSLIFTAGCVSPYKPPKKDEPAAIIKSKFTYNHKTAVAMLPVDNVTSIGYLTELKITHNDELFLVFSKSYQITRDKNKPLELQTVASRIHQGKPVTFHILSGIVWTTRTQEWVTKTERKSRQVYKNISEYNSTTRRTETRGVYVTEYYDERKRVQEWVNKNHFQTCSESWSLTPIKDEIYLLDFANLAIHSGCTLQGYRQIPGENGSFKLEPVGELFDPNRKKANK